MKKAAKYLVTVAILAVVHSVTLYAVAMLALIGSLGAPQGGDVPRTHEQAAHAEAMKPLIHGFTWFLEHLVAILKFPMAGHSEPLPAFHAAWILNSVIWACFVLMLAKLVAKFWPREKRPNQSLQNNAGRESFHAAEPGARRV